MKAHLCWYAAVIDVITNTKNWNICVNISNISFCILFKQSQNHQIRPNSVDIISIDMSDFLFLSVISKLVTVSCYPKHVDANP